MVLPQNDFQRSSCLNPATGEVIGTSHLNSSDDVFRAVEHGHAVQPRWAALSVKERVDRIKPLVPYLFEHADELAALISQDNGKTRMDAITAEIVPAVLAVKYYCRKARRFLSPRRLAPGTLLLANKSSQLIRVPYGVIGIISPWNYPFSIPFSEVVMALLAGNAVILKVASETQMVGRALERCFSALDLPNGLFTYINVPGSKAGPLLLDAGIDKLFFTGSIQVGQTLMAQAAQTLTPLVLELGGNDPMLVCSDADIDRAAAGAVWAGLQNCGQTCGGVERIYVHRSIYQPFINALATRVKRLRVGPDTDHNVELGAMTTAKQMREVKRQVVAATKAGAIIYARSTTPSDAKGNFLPALVLTKVNHNMDIMRLETFGPVLCVMPVDDMEQAVTLANDSNLGLTASVWTKKTKIGLQMARQIKAGVVMINDHLMSHGLAEAPWGGFKQSGIGRTHGVVGMDEMTQVQCLVRDYMPFVKRNLWWYPHGPATYKGMKGFLAFLGGQGVKARVNGLREVIQIFLRSFFADK